MTQPEDDAARLIDKIQRALNTTKESRLEGYAACNAVKLCDKLRANLAERDARERMVREAAELGLSWCDYWNGLGPRPGGYDSSVMQSVHDAAKIRAAFSAKSDDKTPTTTE